MRHCVHFPLITVAPEVIAYMADFEDETSSSSQYQKRSNISSVLFSTRIQLRTDVSPFLGVFVFNLFTIIFCDVKKCRGTLFVFIARQHMRAEREIVLPSILSVCLSVCLFLRLSNANTLSKRMD